MDEPLDNLDAVTQARVGRSIKGKWTLDRLVGVGGMAAVYAATHRNGNRVAIKMLHPALSADTGLRARFLREGYVANAVDHPGVVRVLDDDTAEDGAAFLVMELLEGETVDSRWEHQGFRLPFGDALSIADQLLDVLAAAHDKGIHHRDIKPENLFLTRDGRLKVLDFGIARMKNPAAAATATKTGTMMGTPAFMAPEQALGRTREVDGQSDLWAVGATLFTLITGRFVHIAESVNEQLVLAATRPAPSLSEVLPGAPAALVAVVDRALAFHKSARFDDAHAMQVAVREAYATLGQLGALGVALASEPAPPALDARAAATVVTAPHQAPRARRAWLLAAPLLAAVVLAGLVLAARSADRPPSLAGDPAFSATPSASTSAAPGPLAAQPDPPPPAVVRLDDLPSPPPTAAPPIAAAPPKNQPPPARAKPAPNDPPPPKAASGGMFDKRY